MRISRLVVGTIAVLVLCTLGAAGDQKARQMARFVVRHPDPPGLTERLADTIVCEYRGVSTVEIVADESSKRLQPRYESSISAPLQVVYSEIQTASPKLKANMGETPLTVVKRTDDEIELAERTDAGNLVMHSLFLTEKAAIMTKQYRIVQPFGLIMMGKCW